LKTRIVLVMALAIGAQAQRIIPVSGKECAQQAQYVNVNLLGKFVHPHDWTLVIVCVDSDFDRILQDTGLDGLTWYAFTDLKRRYSYFRASALLHDTSYNHRTKPLFIVAHEAGHIMANVDASPKGEAIADAIADRLIAGKPYDDLIPREVAKK
jgi:hypothetical protein